MNIEETGLYVIPGFTLLYESGRSLHGRTSPFTSESYINFTLISGRVVTIRRRF